MTDTVSGGLDEPGGLQPEQGALRLASPEDIGTRADWEHAAAEVLRKTRRLGADDPDDAVWSALTHTTYDGVEVPLLGTSGRPGAHNAVRPERVGPWDVRTSNHGDSAAARHDLENGATSLWLTVGPDLDLAAALEGVLLDVAPVVLTAPGRQLAAARSLADLLGDNAHAATNLGGDPLADDGADALAVAGLARELGVLGIVVDATPLHEQGASDMQEVGYSLAVGAHVLRQLTEHGFELDEAAGLLEFRYAATDEQLPTIAKLRAARRCWARMIRLSEGAATTQRQHAVTSRAMLSAHDPWVNMLRGTVAALAAGVGGADAVTVVPFDAPLGEPDVFGRRIARNVSSLLIAESHVAAVADPAGGAYAYEQLTDDLAGAAWAELQRIEASGGVLAALEDGSLTRRVIEVARRRDQDVATRAMPITGLSEFPHLFETLPERTGDPDGVRRYGAAFEALRAEVLGEPVYLATMGARADTSALTGFLTNLFAAGGVHVEVAEPAPDLAALVEENDGQPVVFLVGTEAAYAAWGQEAADAMRGCGAARVIVAGETRPWADDAFQRGDDALAFLTRTREALR